LAKKIWTIWKYALGSFEDNKTRSYDNIIAITRTFIFISYLITNCFIIAGVIRHWNNMSHQNSTMRAGVSPYSLEPEKKSDDLKETKEKLEAQYTEPEGEPSF
tara:strand:- start:174 stop:482 length:309 start_codon:yes stop_codon:yes gene_type:complete